MFHKFFIIIFYLTLAVCDINSLMEKKSEVETVKNTVLTKLVNMFSKPGAFKQINTLLGENSIEETSTSCPKGEDGLECRRAEARRSVDCHGDCYCSNCAEAEPRMWITCCRQSLRCCPHLAAACRTCDQPVLYPFCSKHFKKCINQINEMKEKQI